MSYVIVNEDGEALVNLLDQARSFICSHRDEINAPYCDALCASIDAALAKNPAGVEQHGDSGLTGAASGPPLTYTNPAPHAAAPLHAASSVTLQVSASAQAPPTGALATAVAHLTFSQEHRDNTGEWPDMDAVQGSIQMALDVLRCPHPMVQQTITHVGELRIDTETRCAKCGVLLKTTDPKHSIQPQMRRLLCSRCGKPVAIGNGESQSDWGDNVRCYPSCGEKP